MRGPILATPFNGQTLKTTGPGVDSGFPDIDAVIAAMGPDHITRTPRLVVYGDDINRVVFSDLTFHVDPADNNG